MIINSAIYTLQHELSNIEKHVEKLNEETNKSVWLLKEIERQKEYIKEHKKALSALQPLNIPSS